MQDHLLSLYWPWSSDPFYERMIDGVLWQFIQADMLVFGLLGMSLMFDFWTIYRFGTMGKKRDN